MQDFVNYYLIQILLVHFDVWFNLPPLSGGFKGRDFYKIRSWLSSMYCTDIEIALMRLYWYLLRTLVVVINWLKDDTMLPKMIIFFYNGLKAWKGVTVLNVYYWTSLYISNLFICVDC